MINAIRIRRSVRTYENKTLTDADQIRIHDLLKSVADLTGPFGNAAKWFYYNSESFQTDVDVKIGTYGTIKNAPAFIGGVIGNHFQAMVDYGYLFERLIIELTRLEFGTVWLAATYNREAVGVLTSENEIVPSISPVGYPAERLSFVEKMVRMGIRANQRKPYGQLFFTGDFSHPVKEDGIQNSTFKLCMELVRLGPSATNQQPWRIVFAQDTAHFYLKRTPNYATALPFDVQAIDIGIALFHFASGLEHENRKYAFIKAEPVNGLPGLEYVLSIKII
jgi:hypothetical protein